MADASPTEVVEAPRRLDHGRLPLAIIVAAIIVALAILWTANEIRYQGCVSLANEQVIHHVGYEQKCSRLPWGA